MACAKDTSVENQSDILCRAWYHWAMKPITLEVLASPGCHTCKTFEEFWHSIEKEWPTVSFHRIEVTTPEGQQTAGKYMILTSPGIILNGELFSTGGFNKGKFLEKIKELSQ